MKLTKNSIINSIAIILSIFLVFFSENDKGKGAFIAIPLLIIINGGLSIYGFLTKQNKIGFMGLFLFIITPILAFIVFIRVFPFLTR